MYVFITLIIVLFKEKKIKPAILFLYVIAFWGREKEALLLVSFVLLLARTALYKVCYVAETETISHGSPGALCAAEA